VGYTGDPRCGAHALRAGRQVAENPAESQHLAIAKSYATKFKKAILAGPCGQADETKAVAQVQSKLEAAQNAFDASQSGYVYPPYDG
jgi:hypothetical protein